MKLTFQYKGSASSGFHGHAGRPGEVGGSTRFGGTLVKPKMPAKALPTSLYHGTSANFVESIVNKGLIAQPGAKGKACWGTQDKWLALYFGLHVATLSDVKYNSDTVAIVEVTRSKFRNHGDGHWAHSGNLPKEAILAVHFYKVSDLNEAMKDTEDARKLGKVKPVKTIVLKEDAILYVPVVIIDE